MKDLCKRLYVWKPISFVTHFFWPGGFLAFVIYCQPVLGLAGLAVHIAYERSEDSHMDSDKAYEDIQGLWVALVVFGATISILVLCNLIPACPMLEA